MDNKNPLTAEDIGVNTAAGDTKNSKSEADAPSH